MYQTDLLEPHLHATEHEADTRSLSWYPAVTIVSSLPVRFSAGRLLQLKHNFDGTLSGSELAPEQLSVRPAS